MPLRSRSAASGCCVTVSLRRFRQVGNNKTKSVSDRSTSVNTDTGRCRPRGAVYRLRRGLPFRIPQVKVVEDETRRTRRWKSSL